MWPPQFTSSPPDPVEKWVHVRMLREINLVHPHVLLVPLLLYFLVLQLIQKWSLNLLCLRCNQIQFHIFDLLQYEGQILLVYMKNDDHDHNELADDDWAAFSTKHCLAMMTTNGIFQSLLAHPFQEGYTRGHVCQGRTPSFEDKEGSRRGGQRLALYFSNSNGLISVTLAVVRS